MIRRLFSIPFRSANALFAFAAVLLSLSLLHARSPFQPAPSPLHWSTASSPVRTDLTTLQMLSASEGYAAGTYLLHYSSGRWEMMSGLPWTSDVNALQVLERDAVFAATLEPTNESFLFRYDGRRWTRMSHPLANFITAIALDRRGIGWLGGWGEFAQFDGKQWKQYPPFPEVGSVLGIVGRSEADLRVYAAPMGVFRFRNGAWDREIAGDTLRAFTVTGTASAAAVCRNTMWLWDGSSWSQHSTHPALASVRNIRRMQDGTWYAVRAHGSILQWNDAEWRESSVGTDVMLNDIVMVRPDEGWCIGNAGSIFRGTAQPRTPERSPAGFRSEHVFQSGKGLEGEYGVALEDVNGDGKADLYTVSLYNQNLLFINHTKAGGAVQFRDESVLRNAAGGEADTSILSTRDIDQGIGVADLDNDGDRELYLCSLVGHNSILLNKGDGHFEDISHESGHAAVPPGRSNSVCFADADNDGDLDLFIANESGTNRMFENDGNGSFTDVTAAAALSTLRGGVGAVFGDLDKDGRSDLVVTCWTDRCRVYRNVSDGSGIRFEEVTERAGIGGEAYERSNGVALGDIDNDGDPDLFIAKRKGMNRLFLNDGTGRFTDISASAIGSDTLISYGVCFADLNNDGWLDLYISVVGTNRFYVNNGDRTFTDRTYEYGLQHTGYNTGVATGDVDDDGDLDLYAASYINGESRLFVNGVNDRHWIKVDVEGTQSNRDGIGAVVDLYIRHADGTNGPLLASREVTSGSGYASHPALRVHFGLPSEGIYAVTVRFPASGIVRTAGGIPNGTRVTVREEEGWARTVTLAGGMFHRILIDPSIRREAAVLAMVLMLTAASMRRGGRRSGWGRTQQALFHAPVVLLYLTLIVSFFYDRSFIGRWIPLFLAAVILIVLHLYYERIILARTARREREETRRQIARDLHDDIASTLSSATIYLNILKKSLRRPTLPQKELLGKVDEAIGSASEGMTDIVWAIAPKHDTLADLVTRIRMMVTEAAESHGIAAACRIDGVAAAEPISDIVRRNIYLIMKEAVRNSCTHAQGDRIELSVLLVNGRMLFTLADNGRGVDSAAAARRADDVLHGHGLSNMHSRAQEIGADFRIAPGMDGGTVVTVSVEMTHLHH